MRMATTIKQQSNPDVKQVVIVFTRPTPRQLKCSHFHMISYAPHPQTQPHPPTSSPYPSLIKELPKSGSSSGAGFK
eukprot:4678282-Ditylum_brightwellii.AAC.1